MITRTRFNAFILSTLALVFSQVAATSVAQQLSQPASVLPWTPNQQSAETQHAFELPTITRGSDSPMSLLDVQNSVQRKGVEEKPELPNVEKEHHSDLGHLDAAPATPHRYSLQRNRATSSKSGRSFSLLRALGIQASRGNNRR